jgi:hypothetical protein
MACTSQRRVGSYRYADKLQSFIISDSGAVLRAGPPFTAIGYIGRSSTDGSDDIYYVKTLEQTPLAMEMLRCVRQSGARLQSGAR